jgi:carbonic anhydrase
MSMKGLIGRRCRLLLVLSLLFVAGGAASASEVAPGLSADDALQKLMDGNKRYTASEMTLEKLSGSSTRQALVKGQQPYAVILSCSDSRVPPEIVFDQGLGEIFVIRVAGNIPDPVVLGSIEYAVEHLGSPLIMVLGHEKCGAVTAAVEAKGKPEGNIGAIIKTIDPAVKEARKEVKGQDNKNLVETAINDNIHLVCNSLVRQSKLIKKMVDEKKVRIVAAKYDLDDGAVRLLDSK